MIVRFKNALIEVSKILFNELSIDFYLYGTTGGHIESNGGRGKDMSFLFDFHKFHSFKPNNKKLNQLIYEIEKQDYDDFLKQDIVIEDYLTDYAKEMRLQCSDYGTQAVYERKFKKPVYKWVEDNKDSELAKKYITILEETREIIKNVKFKDGYLDLSEFNY